MVHKATSKHSSETYLEVMYTSFLILPKTIVMLLSRWHRGSRLSQRDVTSQRPLHQLLMMLAGHHQNESSLLEFLGQIVQRNKGKCVIDRVLTRFTDLVNYIQADIMARINNAPSQRSVSQFLICSNKFVFKLHSILKYLHFQLKIISNFTKKW